MRIIYSLKTWSRHSDQRQTVFFEHRRDPVPHVGSGYFPRGCCYRAVRTQQEHRLIAADRDEHEPRMRRNKRVLPSAWDDIPRGDWKDRSWKRHRKTQYKVTT